jgi:hypothetical protein
MSIEDFKKALEHRPTKREQEESRIEYELGPKYLDFALAFERDISKSPSTYLGDISIYPEGMTEKEDIIWYRACCQAYANFFSDYFDQRLCDKGSNKEAVFGSDFIAYIDKNVEIAKSIFTDEEVKYLIDECKEIVKQNVGNADLNIKEEKKFIAEMIRDSVDQHIRVIGAERFSKGAKLK